MERKPPRERSSASENCAGMTLRPGYVGANAYFSFRLDTRHNLLSPVLYVVVHWHVGGHSTERDYVVCGTVKKPVTNSIQPRHGKTMDAPSFGQGTTAAELFVKIVAGT